MRKVVLMFGVVVCFAGESLAETWNCGPATDGVYSDSVKCTYDEASKTLTISGEGEMGNYGYNWDTNNIDAVNGYTSSVKSSAPWAHKGVTSIVVEQGVTSIGAHAFVGETNIVNIRGMENIKKVGASAFYHAFSLNSINMPNVEEIGSYAFFGTKSLIYAGFNPDKITFYGDDIFKDSKISKCVSHGDCGSCGDKFVQAGVGCVDNCFDGYYPTNPGYCKVIKLRYTLPEADAATSDDNENMIEWIFE